MPAPPAAEDQADLHFVPFPPIEAIAMVGDRRTAAMVAADGTVCWHCRPRFDSTPFFGCLLDLKGGFWSLAPEDRELGVQRYIPGTAVLVTKWEAPGSVLELTDCMLWPEDDRPAALIRRHVILRRLRCLSGTRLVSHHIRPRDDFTITAAATQRDGWLQLEVPAHDLGLWCSHPMDLTKKSEGGQKVFELAEGGEVWAVLDSAEEAPGWTVEKAAAALEETLAYWRDWTATLVCDGARAAEIRFAAMVVSLCTYAPTGALVAAPTTSLPERVPGEYNYDYRYCWVRDGAIAIGLLAELGLTEPVGRFLSWTEARLNPEGGGEGEMPLQTLYRVDGGKEIFITERPDVEGYRSCKPVRFGNPVFRMEEIDGFGFLAHCAWLFAKNGGAVTDAHWNLVRRSADFIAGNWGEKDAGTWELMPSQHFVSTKVMSWVALDRAIALAEMTGRKAPNRWSTQRKKIHAEVLDKGFCEKTGAFRQIYGSEALDGALLLIPIMGFLPPEDERVRGTVAAVDKVLKLNGLVHRFIPVATPGRPDKPMGDKEGAFLMCHFWLAQAWTMLGEPDKAAITIARAEQTFGTTGLISEAADARQNPGLLGNVPLLFSQVEYARALMASDR